MEKRRRKQWIAAVIAAGLGAASLLAPVPRHGDDQPMEWLGSGVAWADSTDPFTWWGGPLPEDPDFPHP